MGVVEPAEWPADMAGVAVDPWHATSAHPAEIGPRDAALLFVVDYLNIASEDVLTALDAAQVNGTDVAREFIAARLCSEVDFAQAAAAYLGLRVDHPSDIDQIVSLGDHETIGSVEWGMRTCDRFLTTKIFLTPIIENLSLLRASVATNPVLKKRARVTTPSRLRHHRIERESPRLLEAARLSLSADALHLSARIVMTGAQGAAASLLAFVLFACLVHFWNETLFGLHLLAIAGFGSWIAMRFIAAIGFHSPPAISSPADSVDRQEGEGGLPIYTVVVALRNERSVVPKLVDHLDALNWPKSRLEIFLVCEADDEETPRLCRRLTADMSHVFVVEVPPAEPRTKPKALNFILPRAEGDLLVLYDAEDKPHPDQLREAYRRFRVSSAQLGCLQAPLVVGNFEGSRIAALFAMEYAALFRAFLPWLAHHGFPIPLGGTSNHFRTSALRAVCGWDSHNVTEDADLGMRLARGGWAIETITLPTVEDAPETIKTFFPQRTRWLKGWLQTYAVHMRDPLRLWRELGACRFLVFQLLFHGMMTSALILPGVIILLSRSVFAIGHYGYGIVFEDHLLLVDAVIMVGGIVSFLALAMRGASNDERRAFLSKVLVIPAYWLLISCAAWRALLQLFCRPHGWEKTPHGLESRANPGDPRYRIDPIFDIAT
ncbi:Glycosyltransferase, catalytic subunit of cellulose synthase and poly-beta-1,6-N-acetylglucosamine synthase [Fulvimarina manganoxydans]|uniref:Glycosyltransferase, catalytic subunit of cellulose synthase and poly-beta-1,6-N-acetylglucosamine synthase n=2 Tax=Fulvimarina manganoxydans TaxID=937218 RepID=A0A1W2BU65_9HYPH|nr:Glycosyltransferase, catalytic subunit of cellulose synthase and poly-beta-1,6-N-acetylglucosamine synthase [Fulvimarina manganoxydans]